MLLALQYQYWEGENGVRNSEKLTAKIEQQRLTNNQRQDNALRADIEDLKTGLEAVEEHARLDLGLIKPDETFVQMSTAANIVTMRASAKLHEPNIAGNTEQRSIRASYWF